MKDRNPEIPSSYSCAGMKKAQFQCHDDSHATI